MNNDTIYRQAAIDAMEGLPKYFDKTGTLCLDYADVLAVLSEHLPSAQPHEHWIPVTERLPEKEGMYLVTSFNGRPKLDVARFYIDEEGLGHFSCNWGGFDYVTAWMMPLPEPYKGGVQEWTMIL